MSLIREKKSSNDVRTPAVPRGRAVIVTKYREQEKVALVNPADLSMLEDSHDLIESLGSLRSNDLSEIELKAQTLEDRPNPSKLIEQPDEIAALLDPGG